MKTPILALTLVTTVLLSCENKNKKEFTDTFDSLESKTEKVLDSASSKVEKVLDSTQAKASDALGKGAEKLGEAAEKLRESAKK